MAIKSKDLLSNIFPEISDIWESLKGYEGLISNKKAKKLLGWQPVHS